MNEPEGKTKVLISSNDYRRFVIYNQDDPEMIQRIVQQSVNWEIVTYVTSDLWNAFQAVPFDPDFLLLVRHEMRQMYHDRYSANDNEIVGRLKDAALDRLGETLHEYLESVQNVQQQMLEVESTHKVLPLIHHVVREYGFDHGSVPIEEIIEHVLFLIHPDLFID